MNVAENGGIVEESTLHLGLEMDRINSLNLSWTLVHPITDDSPLFQFDAAFQILPLQQAR
jgi:inward rectifier potassium channel